MGAAKLIEPFLLEANRRRPELARINTTDAAGELLQLALALAGPEWDHVGKTNDMDGAHWAPAGFTPFEVRLTRPDGQTQMVRIVGVSQDAAYHRPSRTQVKVIANSGANDPGPWEHGPAKLTPYDIDPVNYRWHNPPVPQFGNVAWPIDPPVSIPTPQPQVPLPVLPGREEMMRAGQWLDEFYGAPAGLQRTEGLSKAGRPDWEGVGAWLFDVYLHARVAGKSEAEAREIVAAQIRQTEEWRGKHNQ